MKCINTISTCKWINIFKYSNKFKKKINLLIGRLGMHCTIYKPEIFYGT